MTNDRALVLLSGEGRRLGLGSSLELCFKGTEPGAEARYSLCVAEAGPEHPGTTPHVHREHEDIFFVTGGTLAFQAGDEFFEAPAGAFVLIPRGLSHRWWNPSPEPVTFLNLHVPGQGFEHFVNELVALSGTGSATPEAMAELGTRYDEHFDAGVLRARYGADDPG
ncbi:MAG: cupin domain-containing protein [Gaiellaceae bacterium]